jgi:Predicted membrane protein (DUF2142)
MDSAVPSARVISPLPAEGAGRASEGKRTGSGIRLRDLVFHPGTVFTLLSLVFGCAVMAVVPPLRGHDEPAHFLRAYAFTNGEILPATKDAHGRSGTYLPARIYDDFVFFEQLLHRSRAIGFDYRKGMADHARFRASLPAVTSADPPVFVLFAGSESYTPVGYLPYILGAAAARALDLDFLGTLAAMRAAGLLALTAIIVGAIACAPGFGWPLLLIAMLPSALYARSIVGVDAPALAFTVMAVALCLRALQSEAVSTAQRALWITLSVLTKPPHIVFVGLEAMTGSMRELRSRWPTVLMIVLPGLVLLPLWVLATGGEVAAWRMVHGTDKPDDLFDPLRKLAFMLANPLHFPQAVINSMGMDYGPQILRQIIGVLGWLDTSLRAWVYPALALLLIAVSLGWNFAAQYRLRVAMVAGLVTLAYVAAVYLVFYLAWTPPNYHRIDGVQGRYFVVVLPMLSLVVSALVRVGLPERTRAIATIAGAVIAGIATVEAVLRVDWP